MASDLMEKAAEAMYLANVAWVSTSPPRPWDEIPAVGRESYFRMAKAALEAIHIDTGWYGAPGDKKQCPCCDTPFEAVEHGPLDIRWAIDP